MKATKEAMDKAMGFEISDELFQKLSGLDLAGKIVQNVVVQFSVDHPVDGFGYPLNGGYQYATNAPYMYFAYPGQMLPIDAFDIS